METISVEDIQGKYKNIIAWHDDFGSYTSKYIIMVTQPRMVGANTVYEVFDYRGNTVYYGDSSADAVDEYNRVVK